LQTFIAQLADKVTAVLNCFDRVIFKGHLRAICFAQGLENFMAHRGLPLKEFGRFVQTHSDRLVLHAKATAAKHHRPYRFLRRHLRKDEEAARIAAELRITKGLVCIFSELECCPSFKLAWGEGRPRLAPTRRKCLCLYYYFLHPNFGLIHVRLQSWFPFTVQIAVNGHEWLARELKRRGLAFEQLDNAFLHLANPKRAQQLADQFPRQDWPALLAKLARFVNPLLDSLLAQQSYYWTVDQAEFATDILFQDRAALAPLYRELVKHALLCLGARDLLGFLGKKLTANFKSQVLTDFKTRVEGMRVKHRVGKNWIKMYDKFGLVLRIETVINHPYGFLIRRHGIREGKPVLGWFPMTKGVTGLYRYAQVARSANHRYLQALAVVQDPARAQRLLHDCTRRVAHQGRTYRGFNPAAKEDIAVFQAVLDGAHHLHGFRNQQIRQVLYPRGGSDPATQRRSSARVSRLFGRLHVRGLIAKIPHSRRWRVTGDGHAFLSMSIQHHAEAYPQTIMQLAA
jgi:hypothetical protein